MYPRIIQKFDNFLVKIVNKYANRKWFKSPITKQIKGDTNSYIKLAERAKHVQYPIVDQFENKNTYKINTKFFHELALHTQVGIKKSEICYQHGRLLYSCLSHYIKTNNIYLIF